MTDQELEQHDKDIMNEELRAFKDYEQGVPEDSLTLAFQLRKETELNQEMELNQKILDLLHSREVYAYRGRPKGLLLLHPKGFRELPLGEANE